MTIDEILNRSCVVQIKVNALIVDGFSRPVFVSKTAHKFVGKV